MSEITAQDMAKAREIRLAIEKSCRYGPIDAVDPHDGSVQRDVESIIATAIREEGRVKPGCVRTDDGVEHKVVGTLEFTAEGHVLGDGARVFSFMGDRVKQFMASITATEITNYDCPDTACADKCYSNPEAANAAQHAKDNNEHD